MGSTVFRILQTLIKPSGFAFGILYQCLQYAVDQCRTYIQKLMMYMYNNNEQFKECIAQLDNARTELALTHSQLKSTTEVLLCMPV